MQRPGRRPAQIRRRPHQLRPQVHRQRHRRTLVLRKKLPPPRRARPRRTAPAARPDRQHRPVGAHPRTPRKRATLARACRLVAHATCQQGYGVSRAHHSRQPTHIPSRPRTCTARIACSAFLTPPAPRASASALHAAAAPGRAIAAARPVAHAPDIAARQPTVVPDVYAAGAPTCTGRTTSTPIPPPRPGSGRGAERSPGHIRVAKDPPPPVTWTLRCVTRGDGEGLYPREDYPWMPIASASSRASSPTVPGRFDSSSAAVRA